jgi:hypothetical protein
MAGRKIVVLRYNFSLGHHGFPAWTLCREDSQLYYKSFSRPVDERNIEARERVVITHLIKEKEQLPF